MDAINVIVTCTKDKKVSVDPDCEMRKLKKGPIRERSAEWFRRLSERGRQKVYVRDLYAGDHWATVRSFNSSKFKIHIWVCSAGYGLIGMEDSITPYSATFSSSHPDSVTRNVTDFPEPQTAQAWWEQMASRQGRGSGKPRSLSELAGQYPDRALLVVASATYLKAIASDVRKALQQLSDPDLLSIISAGAKSLDGLDDHLVPCDARLQTLVSGARRSLNTRVASYILSTKRTVPRRSSLKKTLRELLAKQPEIQRFDRLPVTDDQVRRFVLSQLQRNIKLCHTPLLRKLRDDGYACEQSRFASLYAEVKEQINGTT